MGWKRSPISSEMPPHRLSRSRGESLVTGWRVHGRVMPLEAFRSSLNELPGELQKINSSFGAAAGAVGSFATTLAELQSRANWYASQIEQASSDLQSAQNRHAAAEKELHTAKHSHAVASDPVSKASWQRALDDASTAVATANADQDEFNGQISNLRSAAHLNHSEYENAANVCCSGLETASHLGIRNSFTHALGHFLHDVGSGIATGVVWAGREVERAGEDVEQWGEQTWKDAADAFWNHPSWGALRTVLEDVKEPLEIAGAVLAVTGLVASVFLTGGADTPLVAAIFLEADAPRMSSVG